VDRRIVSAATLLAVASVLHQVQPAETVAVPQNAASAKSQVSTQASSLTSRPTRTNTRQSEESTCAIGKNCDTLTSYSDSGPWTASCAFFLAQGSLPPARGRSVLLEGREPESLGTKSEDWCVPAKNQPTSEEYDLQFLVATLPDPVTTRLSLSFDRSVEAIGAAAQRCGFYFDHYWLPWQASGAAQAGGDTSQDLRVNQILDQFRLAQPGVMIFKATPGTDTPCVSNPSGAKEHLLYVFLVSESPTTGISKTQFRNAVSYARVLSAPSVPRVHVVGPLFSGSVPSALALNLSLAEAESHLDFVSGTMTSDIQARVLREALATAGRDFKQTLHDDARAQQFVLGFLRQRGLTADGSNVAILMEDETRYAGDVKLPDKGSFTGLRYITFPREISRLRNAYPDTFGSQPTPQGQPAPPTPQRLSWIWKDTTKDQDSVPSFSGQQEPLSQEAVMLSIADVIRQQNIRYVGIAATDIFDILFLSKFLKTAAPNTRLFVLDADLLMVRTDDEARSLDGTLAVTTYPLFARNGDWTAEISSGQGEEQAGSQGGRRWPRSQSSVVLFSSRLAEGIYNAVLFHLDETKEQALREYEDPLLGSQWPNERPPLWLTVVGRTGFWPVSLKQNFPEVPVSPSPRSSPLQGIHHPRERLRFDSPDKLTTFLQAILFLWGVLHLIGMIYDARAGQEWLGQFRIGCDGDSRVHLQYRAFYLVCSTLALSAMFLLVTISCARLCWDGGFSLGSRWFYVFYIAYGVVGLALLAAAAWIAARNVRGVEKVATAWFPWLLFSAIVILWLCLNVRPTGDAIFFAERAFYLGNGVSPLLPLEILLLMYYVWAWMFIRKVRISETKRVRVPDPELLGPATTGSKQDLEGLEEATDNLIFDRKLAPWLTVGFATIFAFVLRPWEQLKSIEGVFYDALIVCVVLFICLLVILSWGRYLRIWSKLRGILRGLERTPLRKAFDRLPKQDYSWSPIWHGDSSRRAYLISARSVECFQALVNCKGKGAPAELVAYRESMLAVFERVVELDANEEDNARSYTVGALQTIFALAAEHLLRVELQDRWDKDTSSDTLDTTEVAERLADGPERYERTRLLAEEFVALRYIGLIHYASAQLKNLVVLLSFGFILALVAVGSYPFLSRRECVWSLAGVFVIFGIGIVMSFAQMDRDAILSRLSGTEPGKLDRDFYYRVVSYGALPLLALLASQFPSIGRFLFSWLQPGLNALH